MNEQMPDRFGDPLSEPFWAAAAAHQLLVQRCRQCGQHQFYPRPFCLACQADELDWVPVTGRGTVYSRTTVHIQVAPDLTPPYTVAIVELDEGPRLLTNIVGPACRIGDRVTVQWRAREGEPPLPVFQVFQPSIDLERA